jgi:hypothetical protein
MNRPTLSNIRVEYAQSTTPEQSVKDSDTVIFLAGPTPQYGGSDPANESWRDIMAADIDKTVRGMDRDRDSSVVLVCPEPQSRRWEDTTYGMSSGQITWEHLWLERSNIIIFWHETRWKPNKQTLKNCYHGKEQANIGIQFRFEVGLYIANTNKIRIFYVPHHAKGVAGVIWWFNNKKDPKLYLFDDYKSVIQTIHETIPS